MILQPRAQWRAGQPTWATPHAAYGCSDGNSSFLFSYAPCLSYIGSLITGPLGSTITPSATPSLFPVFTSSVFVSLEVGLRVDQMLRFIERYGLLQQAPAFSGP